MIVVVGITGYTGRMGQSIARVIETHPLACLAGGVTRSQSLVPSSRERPVILTDNPQELFPQCDVIIDFSHPSSTPLYARLAAEAGKPFLSGTTGLGPDELTVLTTCAQTIPVLYTTNTSLSLIVARQMARLAATLLKGHDYDIAILDKHHRWKKDAPSGTALSLGKAVEEGSGGEKKPTYASLRTGAIVGEHEVLFAGPGENITIHHSVTDRRVFARGAVHAALWLAKQKPGLYSMDDVLVTASSDESALHENKAG